MFPKRDSTGKVTNFKQYYAGEPASQSYEAVHSVPRDRNVHFTAHTVVLDSKGQKVDGLNPSKITSAAYEARPVHAPKAPSRRDSHQRLVSSKYDLAHDPSLKTPQSTTKEFHQAPSGDASVVTPNGRTRRSLIDDEAFRRRDQDIIDLREKHGHNWSGSREAERVGKPPLFNFESPVSEQVAMRKHDGALITSLRVPDDQAPDTWWKPKSRSSETSPEQSVHSSMLEVDEELPDVFRRLTNPKTYHATHKERFRQPGRYKDDNTEQVVIAGQARIMRDYDEQLERPVKTEHHRRHFKKEEDTHQRRQPESQAQDTVAKKKPARKHRKAGQPSIFDRLYAEGKKKMEERKNAPDAAFEEDLKVRKQFGVVRETIPSWQSGFP